MPDDLITHARGCLIGLAIGDALGGPTEGKTPGEILRQWERVSGFLTDGQAGSDDTEYALFNARILLTYGNTISAAAIAEEWKREVLSASNAYKGAGFSEMMAIRNLKEGLMPPASGQHLHSWSDGLAMRVAPFGIVAAGRPLLASGLAAMDGSVTHSGEGILAGQAVAVAIASAMTGNSLEDVFSSVRREIPSDSWTMRGIERAIAIGEQSSDVWSALDVLHRDIACTAYHWSDLGPEAVALAFGLLAASRGDFRDAVLGGVNIGRDTDTIAAIAGAILGARQGIDALPREWVSRVGTVRGVCLRVVQGADILQTADQLAALSRTWGSAP